MNDETAKADCLFVHKWTMWETYERTYPWVHLMSGRSYEVREERQRRRCVLCGRTQDEKLLGGMYE